MSGRLVTLVLALSAAPGPAPAGPGELPGLHRRALEHYQHALEHYGLALGARRADRISGLLRTAVAELVCLQSDAESCLAASREAGRELGAYTGALGDTAVPEPAGFTAAGAFVTELRRLSAGWGRDAALAAEALGLLERLRADHLRQRAQRLGRSALERARQRARAAEPPAAIEHWLRAARLARWMLDRSDEVEAGQGLARALLAAGDLGLAAAERRELAAVLGRARRGLQVLGRAEEPAMAVIDKALAGLDTRALPPADLQFDLGPAAARFETDLDAAREQLAALAERAALRSRPSVLLTFLAAYAGVLAQRPEAAAPLADLLETAALTDAYLAARARGLLGRDALLAGDFWRAAQLLRAAEQALAERADSRRLRGLMAANRGLALFFLGRYPDAAAVFGEAAKALAERPAAAFRALLGQAQALLFADRLDAAEETLDRAGQRLADVAAPARRRLERSLAIDHALLAVHRGRAEAAAAAFTQEAAAALEAGDVRAGAIARTNLAELHNDAGRHRRALAEAEAALGWLDPASQADAAWQARCEKGRALAGLGRLEAAGRELRAAIDLVERLRARIGAEGSRRTFAAAKQRLYREALAVAIAAGKPAAGFAIGERARGRAFLDMLGQRRIQLGDPAAQAALGPARERMLAELPPLALGFEAPAAELTGERSAAAARPPAVDPSQGWLSLVSVNPARVADVRAVLRPHEALVSFFHDGRRLHAFLIDRRGLVHAATAVTERKLSARVADLLRRLRRPATSDRRVRRSAGRLWRLTLAPLAERLDGVERLTVVPWGPLHYLPFSALHDGERYAVDRWELAQLPSASVLVMLRQGRAHRRELRRPAVLAFGNPTTELAALPGAEAEAELVGSLFERAQVRKRAAATRRVFAAAADDARLIHLASHGVFLPERPMESYLALAGEPPEQGRLRALDILQLDLSAARLVVLSACSSGEVEVRAGEELVGLSRAFLHAGTPALVAGLWPLSDEAALELVGGFYRRLKRGERPSAALTAAARRLKAQERFGHPFYWAPYTLVGT